MSIDREKDPIKIEKIQRTGETIRGLREQQQGDPENWASLIGLPIEDYSKIESGDVDDLPPRHILAGYANRWGLDAADTIDVLIAAGYLRPISDSLIEEDRSVLMGAMRELFYPTTHRRTFRDNIRDLFTVVKASLAQEVYRRRNQR